MFQWAPLSPRFQSLSPFVSSSYWSRTAPPTLLSLASLPWAVPCVGSRFFYSYHLQEGPQQRSRSPCGRGACAGIPQEAGTALEAKVGKRFATETSACDAGRRRNASFWTCLQTPAHIVENSEHGVDSATQGKSAVRAADSWKPGVRARRRRCRDSKNRSASEEENGIRNRPVTVVRSVSTAQGATAPSQFSVFVAAEPACVAYTPGSAYPCALASTSKVNPASQLSFAMGCAKGLLKRSRVQLHESSAPASCIQGAVVGRRERSKARWEKQMHMLQLEAVLRMRTGPYPAFLKPTPLAVVCRKLSDIWDETDD
ncbi:hypothetical protein TGRUB_251800 [Toxoplasma gondii RUB]|uniref:Uncharacterized protein n=2 Tax=Toxoplasma gondii TaxID=5811 RepID=A0A086LLY5_TOXGO|nr:hypothetical protein TGP89_251800 [Toxoplasma gondii p89]KFG57653.1 hypothetical protein TGRUB_251800 [Toxoplasma gondii RUB]